MYAAVNFGSRLRLHRIRNSEDNVSIEFPEANRNATLYSYALTENFLIFTTSVSVKLIFWFTKLTFSRNFEKKLENGNKKKKTKIQN